MTQRTLYVCQDATESFWQLGQLDRYRYGATLAGWNSLEGEVDAGVPPEVAEVFSTVLVKLGRVNFPTQRVSKRSLDRWEARDGHFYKHFALEQGNAIAHFFDRNTYVQFISTTEASQVQSLFDNPEFSWTLQTQISLLSANPPDIPEPLINTLLDHTFHDNQHALQETGIKAIFMPGVDGDIAGFIPINAGIKSQYVEELEKACEQVSIGFKLVEEQDFRGFI